MAASPVEEARAPESLACGAFLPLTHFLCIKIHVAPLHCGQTHTVAPCWRIEEQIRAEICHAKSFSFLFKIHK